MEQDNEGTATSETLPSKEYKELQRKYEKVRKDKAELAARLAESGISSSSGLERVESLLETVIEALARPDIVGEQAEQYKNAKLINAKKRELSGRAAKVFGQIQGQLADKDEGWADEKYADARKAFDEGRLEEASQKVKDVLSAQPPEDIESLVDKKVQERLKSLGRVDTKEGTATSPRALTLDEAKRVDVGRMPFTSLEETKAKLMEALRSG